MSATRHYFAYLLASAIPVIGHTASFDCKQAHSDIEQTICSNRSLSNLDGVMGEIFTLAIKSNGGLIVDQKTWLRERNSCDTVECLESAYRERLTKLNSFEMPCPLTEERIAGDWAVLDGEFQAFKLEVHRGGLRHFESFRREMFEMDGVWWIEACRLKVKPNIAPDVLYSLRVTKLSEDRLHMVDDNF